MTYQIPLDLIDQIQINLKNEANLPSFNQLNSSIPPLPSIKQAISSIEFSSENLRCNSCNGSLLRGFESLICIYCGQNNHQKSIPQSMSFKSTIGFRLLIDSLGLDSSESVGSPSGDVQSNKGQSSVKDKTSLADLLDLDLKWPDVKKDEIYPKKGFLNLVGEDFDSSFAEGSGEHSSRISIEQQVTREKIGNKESSKFEEQNTESYEAILRFADGEYGESSSWEAEFQFPNQDTAYENLQSSNVSVLPRVEGGIHGDSVSLAPSKSNLTGSDHSSSSGPVNNSSKFDWSADDLPKNSIVYPLGDEKRIDDDEADEWGEFRAVAGPENNHPKPSSAGISGGLDFPGIWNDFSGSVPVEPSQLQTEIYNMLNDESLSLWGNLASESKAEDIHSDSKSINMNQHIECHDSTAPLAQTNDFAFSQQEDQLNIPTDRIQHSTCSQTDEIELQSPQISSVIQNDPVDDERTKSATHMVAEAGDSFDFWNDFKSSTAERKELSNTTGADDKIHYGVGDNTIDSWNDFASSSASKQVHEISSAEVVATDRNGTHDDSYFSTSDNFGAWNNFTGSTVTGDKPFGADHSSGPWNDLSYLTETHADQHQGSGTQAGTGHATFENDGLLDSWSDFRSSNTQVGNSIPEPIVAESTHDQIIVETAPDNQKVAAGNGTFNLWGDFGPSTLVSKTQSQGAGAELSEKNSAGIDNDFFDGWNYSGNSDGVSVNKVMSSSANDDALDSWSEFASPINVGTNSSVSNPANASDPEEAVKLDDPFDTWNTFSSSSGVQTHGDTKVVNESTSERDFLGTSTNLQDAGSSIFTQADQLFPTISDEKCSSQRDASLAPEVPDSLRMENGDVKADKYAEAMNQSESTTKSLHPPSSDVETLISEMHDLSFMLESTLSVPSSKS